MAYLEALRKDKSNKNKLPILLVLGAILSFFAISPGLLFSQTATSVPQNLLLNPGFESGAVSWNGITSGGRSVVVNQFHTGLASAQILVSNQWLRQILQTVSVQASTDYVLEAWVKTSSIGGPGSRIEVRWLNVSGTTISINSSNVLTGTQNWTLLSTQATSPSSAVSATVVLVSQPDPDGAGTTWFDDVIFGVTGTSPPPPPLPTANISASPAVVDPNTTSTLSWNSTNADSCSASGAWSGNKALVGNEVVTLSITSTYTITCLNQTGSAVDSVTVDVTSSPPLPTADINANPISVVQGSTSDLFWTSTDAVSCMASGAWSGNKALSGSEVVTVASTSTYMITCSNQTGNFSDSVSVSATAPPPSPPSNFPSAGLLGYWSMDEVSGMTVTDSLGLSNGTVQGATVATGKLGNARSFDGIDDYVNVPDGAALNATSAITIAGWINSTSFNNGVWLNKGSGTGAQYHLRILSNGGILRFGIDVGGNHFQHDRSFSFIANTWYHIVGLYDGVSIRVYVNGQQVGIPTFVSGTLKASLGAPIDIGKRNTINFFRGLIDEVGIWGRALSAAEVDELYNSGNGLIFSSSAPPTTPSVDITSISSGTVVSNQIFLATDATSTVGVQFTIDEIPVGAEDTASPFSILFNTANITDGIHTLSAIARNSAGATSSAPTVTVTVDNTSERPNIVFIMTDDQSYETTAYMPFLNSLFATSSVKFDEATVSTPLCCPSRANFFSGLYSHNNGVLGNFAPNGGATVFKDQSTIATWLNYAGYRTGLFGKYLNEYNLLGAYVPPGWSDWLALRSEGGGGFYNSPMNDNGALITYGSSTQDYLTDVLANRATQFIQNTPLNQPLFLVYTPYAPHGPSTPADQDIGLFASLPPLRTPAYDEADVTDKPAWVQALPTLGTDPAQEAFKDSLYRKAVESLQAVDRGIQSIFNALAASGRLTNTLVLFTTDNGMAWGEHRHFGKNCSYEECIKVPVWVYRSGLPARVDSALVQNIDYAPTFADLADVVPTASVNGQSFLPRLADSQVSSRSEELLELFDTPAFFDPRMNFEAVRTSQYTYVEYLNGDRELYDRTLDLYQLQNVFNDPFYASVVQSLQAVLNNLRNQ